MSRKFTKRTGIILVFLFVLSPFSFSQIDNFDFLRSGPDDGVKLLKAYVAPFTNAFGAGLNGGWYNTAKPHKLLGFDLTTSFNVGIVPTSDGKFDISSLHMNSITGTGSAPTISGPDESGPSLSYQVAGHSLATFNSPPGTNWRYIPVPTAQIGLGLPLGTEIKGRFVPKINIKDGGISLWGIGVMHNLTQYLPGDKLLPFDVSIFGGYTKLKGNVPISLLPQQDAYQNYTAPYSLASFDNQDLNVEVSGINISAIASLNLPVITFYGGLGYSKTKTAMSLEGFYPTPTYANGQVQYVNDGVKKGEDFQNMEIENFSGMRANIGFRLKLAVLTIHADYTRAQYNVVSTGLGLSFR
jgi:hypothetical protein